MSDLFSLSHRFSRRPLYYITSDSVCQVVFQKFFVFFSAACLSNLLWSLSLVGDLYIISLSVRFVKRFLKLFSSFLTSFFARLQQCRLHDSSVIISYTLLPVKSFSSSFTLFGLCYKKRLTTTIFVHRFVWSHAKTAQWQTFFHTVILSFILFKTYFLAVLPDLTTKPQLRQHRIRCIKSTTRLFIHSFPL